MSGRVDIELASARDVEAIATISRDIVERGLGWNWTPARVSRALRDKETEVIVARKDGRVVGFAIMKFLLDESHLLLFAVDVPNQRHGVGRSMMDWLETMARTAGIRTIYLEVRAGNRQARNFYRSLGYRDVSLRRRYYSGVEDAVVMANNLAALRAR